MELQTFTLFLLSFVALTGAKVLMHDAMISDRVLMTNVITVMISVTAQSMRPSEVTS